MEEYAEATSIHGIAYIFEEGKSVTERVIWIALVLVALVFAILNLCYVYKQWQDDPIMTTVRTTGLPLDQIEFPTITICAQGAVDEIIGKF